MILEVFCDLMSVEIDGENDKVVGFFLQFNPIFGYCFQFCLEMVIKKIFFLVTVLRLWLLWCSGKRCHWFLGLQFQVSERIAEISRFLRKMEYPNEDVFLFLLIFKAASGFATLSLWYCLIFDQFPIYFKKWESNLIFLSF